MIDTRGFAHFTIKEKGTKHREEPLREGRRGRRERGLREGPLPEERQEPVESHGLQRRDSVLLMRTRNQAVRERREVSNRSGRCASLTGKESRSYGKSSRWRVIAHSSP